MALRDLLVRFGIDVDGREKLLETDVAIRRTILNAERLGGTLKRLGGFLIVGALVNGLKNFVEEQINAADALRHNAEKLGISTEELQKYQYAAQMMNVSTQETAVALRFFNRAVGEASLGTKSAVKVFDGLGIKVKDAGGNVRPTNELLFEFSDKLKTIPSQAQRTAYAMRTLGRGGSALLPVLQRGSDGLKEIFKDVDELGGGFNDAFIQAAHETDVQLKRLKMAWRGVYVAIATEVLPIIKRWTERSIVTAKHLIDLSEHTYGFRTALMALTAGAVILGLKRLLGIFNPFKASVKDVMMAMLANAPLVAFIALMTALYVVFDDFYTFLIGGDSVLGDFLNRLGGAGSAKKFREDLVAAFEKVGEALAPLMGQLAEFGLAALKAFADTIPYVIKWGGIVATAVVAVIDSAVSGLRSIITIVTGIPGLFKKGADGIAGSDSHILADLDAQNSAWEKRMEAYGKVKDVFDSIGNPKLLTANQFPTRGMDVDKGGNINLPAPPPAPMERPIQVQITNNISGTSATPESISRATKDGVKSGLSQNRDTYAAVTAGGPS